MNALKLLVLCSRFPYPLEKGDKLRLFHQLKYLSRHYKITLVSIIEEEIIDAHLMALKPFVSAIHLYKITPFKRLKSLVKATFTGLPFQVSYFYDKKIKKEIVDLIKEVNPDHIYCQLARMAEYVKDIDIPKTIDYMDAFGVSMDKRASVAGTFHAIVYRNEALRMKKYESDLFQHFDHHTIISEQDREHLQLKHPELVLVNPNGIDDNFFVREEGPKSFDLLFVGNMGYLPNIEAAEYIVKKIKPHLQRPDLNLLIAGARPDKRVKQLAADDVVITGWLEDIRYAYLRARIFIAPIWSGTGQQNKILEAMAMGVPCITTKEVNNAIGARNEDEILVAESRQDFIDAIYRLLDDEELYEKIKTQASVFVKKKFSWEQNGEILHNIFSNTQ